MIHMLRHGLLLGALSVLIWNFRTLHNASHIAVDVFFTSVTRTTPTERTFSDMDQNQTSVYYEIPLLIHLRGELGNHLSQIAHAYAVKWKIEQEYPFIQIHVLGQHQNAPKWEIPTQILHQCFPKLVRRNHFDTSHGRWDSDYRNLVSMEQRNDVRLHVDRSCQHVGNCWNVSVQHALRHIQATTTTLQSHPMTMSQKDIVPSDYNISWAPVVLHSHALSTADYLIDEYYHKIRDLFEFDTTACCQETAREDETVVHVRNFAGQSELLTAKGFAELSPEQLVQELVVHHQTASAAFTKNVHQIAIVGRDNSHGWSFPQEHASTSVGNYVDELSILEPYATSSSSSSSSSFPTTIETAHVRWIRGQDIAQDFCFLRSAKSALIGTKQSTFVHWAAILSNATDIRLYAVSNNITRQRRSGLLEHYVWKNQDLRQRFHFETIEQK